jgi:hypothetical protein
MVCAALFLLVMGCASMPDAEYLLNLSDREVQEEEKAFLARYMENLRWHVYFKEDSAEEPLFRDVVARMARSYIQARGEVLAEEAGAYIEIDAVSEGESGKENHYGTALVTCTMIEPFAGVTLGVVTNRAPRTFSKVDQFDAKANSVQAVLPAMAGEAVAQTRGFLLNLYSKGLLYELVTRGMADSRTADFRKALAARVRTLRVAGEDSRETRYSFAFFGLPEDAEKAVRKVAAEAGADDPRNAGREGRRLVFDYGL